MPVRTRREEKALRRAGRLVAEVLDYLAGLVAAGMTTGELDRAADAFIRARGGVPAFLGYQGFPASICTSLNDEVVHGIPGDRRLEDGDLLSVDVGVAVDGWIGDAARTYPVGAATDADRRLLEVTRRALAAGVAEAWTGRRTGDIGHAVQAVVEAAGFSVVRDLCGHGVGRTMHEPPQIPNYGRPGTGPAITLGQALAIEPMVNAGGHAVRVLPDGWTVVTADGSRSAHFEHTVLVTRRGPEILTRVE